MSETAPAANQYPENHEAQEEQRIFLEIGPWDRPTAAESTRSYTGPNVYIGLEPNEGDYHQPDLFEGQRRAVGDRLNNEHIILAQGDGRNMPFPDASIHSVYLGNVLPAIPHEDINSMLYEVSRVMDGTGPAIFDIGDAANADGVMDHYFTDEFADDLEAAGLHGVATYSNEDSPEHQELRALWPSAWPSGHVFVVAHKITPDVPVSTEQQTVPAEAVTLQVLSAERGGQAADPTGVESMLENLDELFAEAYIEADEAGRVLAFELGAESETAMPEALGQKYDRAQVTFDYIAIDNSGDQSALTANFMFTGQTTKVVSMWFDQAGQPKTFAAVHNPVEADLTTWQGYVAEKLTQKLELPSDRSDVANDEDLQDIRDFIAAVQAAHPELGDPLQ